VARALQIKRDPRFSQDTLQLTGLNGALDVVDAGNRKMETPIALAPRNWACDGPTRQFIESAR
jgi:hypothetical protein